MIANGFDVAVMEHHVSSSGGGLTNPYAQARISYYGISGIPNSYFDGITNVLGGSTGTYNQFVSKYNQRIAVPSNFNVSMNGFNDGLDYTVLVSMENVEPYSGTNLVAHLAVTQSHCNVGGSIYNYVTRRLVPDGNGTPVDFSSNPNQSIVLEFSMNASWVLDDCEFIAWIQDNTTKEILQTAKVAVPDLMPMYYDNAGCIAMNMVPVTNCAGEVAPNVTIVNEGAENLTSLEINYQVNEEELNMYNWSGDLEYGETEVVELPLVSFEVQDQNNLMVYTTNPNGNPDEDPMNDTTATAFAGAAEVVPDIYLFLKLDDNPGETSYELKNSAGNVLYSGGPFTTPGQFVKDTFDISMDDCYTFIIYDEGGDGLGEGAYYMMRESNFNAFFENYEFTGYEELVQFSVDLVGVDESRHDMVFNVFPNPATDKTYVEFTLEQSQEVALLVYDLVGKVVIESGNTICQAGKNVITLNAGSMNPGVYFVSLKSGGQTMIKKITIR